MDLMLKKGMVEISIESALIGNGSSLLPNEGEAEAK
jgi:hypothetical protein